MFMFADSLGKQAVPWTKCAKHAGRGQCGVVRALVRGSVVFCGFSF